ncbi:MAG: efflux RND transporter periplasmic adaptor subunit, partial [Sphingomonadales bacterium]
MDKEFKKETIIDKISDFLKTLLGKLEEKTESSPAYSSGMDKVVEKTLFEKWKKPIVYGSGALFVLILVLVFMPEGGRVLKVQNDRVVVSEVTRGEFDDYIPVRAQVAPLRTVFLDAIEGGRVEEIYIEDGASVEVGQPLVLLSNTTLQLTVLSNEAQVSEQLNNLRNTELALEQNRLSHKSNLIDINYNITRLGREIERKRPLVEDGHVSKAEFEQLEDEYNFYIARREVTLESQANDERLQKAQMAQLKISGEQLKRNLEVAQKNLENLNVKAPVSGRLTAFNVEVGQSLSRGERIGRVDDPSNFKVTANIDEFYLARVDIGQTADFSIGGGNYQLRISKIYPQVTNGTFEVDLVFTDNEPGGIRRGQTVQLNLQLGDPSTSVLIPNGAFYQDTGGNWVFVVAPDGSRAVKRNVRLGRRNVRFIEVLDGLEPGEKVIT